MTAIADEFGGEIPVGPFALIGDEEIGRGVVETLESHRSSAVLMRGHGVFALGSGRAGGQVRRDVRGGGPDRARGALAGAGRAARPGDSIDALYHRYQNVYGQR